MANLATEMSNNEEGVRMVKMACQQIENLCPQVINAALTLAARSDSAVAQENMEAFRRKWEGEVQNLTDSVDEIVTIHDFLAVSEAHILEDVTQCVGALQVCSNNSLVLISKLVYSGKRMRELGPLCWFDSRTCPTCSRCGHGGYGQL